LVDTDDPHVDEEQVARMIHRTVETHPGVPPRR